MDDDADRRTGDCCERVGLGWTHAVAGSTHGSALILARWFAWGCGLQFNQSVCQCSQYSLRHSLWDCLLSIPE
jgi:hypothetical protein